MGFIHCSSELLRGPGGVSSHVFLGEAKSEPAAQANRVLCDGDNLLGTLFSLGLALALGLLVGVERGWQERAAAEGSRIAGIRTFGLIGLLGGLWELLGRGSGEIVLGIAFLAFVVLMSAAHVGVARAR